MQKDMNKIFDETSDQLDQQTELSKEDAREAMKKLMVLKGASHPSSDQLSSIIPHPKQEDPEVIDADNWDIEYDEE